MTRKDWKGVAELIGIAAIVASLLFVGLELRQSQQIAIAAQYQERIDSATKYFYESLNNDNRIERTADRLKERDWPVGFLTDSERLWLDTHDPEEWAQEEFWGLINLFVFDNYHFQYQSGFLTEEAWQSIDVRLQSIVANSLFARYNVMHRSDRWRASFVDHARKHAETIGSTKSN
jgi:hypothetical protein